MEERWLLASYTWNVDGSGNWNVAANWTGGVPGQFPNAIDDVAIFQNTVPNVNAARTVTIPAGVSITVGSLQFNQTDTYTIATGAAGVLNLQTSVGNSTIAQNGTGAAGTTISGRLTTTTDLTAAISTGTLRLTNTAAGASANLISANSVFNVGSGATLGGSAATGGSNALGLATINLNAGTLALATTTDPVIFGNNVTVTGASTIQLPVLSAPNVDASATLGAVTLNAGANLSVTGPVAKTLTFTSTTLAGSNTTITIGNAPGVVLGQIIDGVNTNVTLRKTGTGQLTASNTSAVLLNDTSDTTIDVTAGTLLAAGTSATNINPLGAARIRLSGGKLNLSSGSGNVTFDNPIDVTATSIIAPQTLAVTFTLGSGASPMTISNGATLTVDYTTGTTANVVFNSDISGAGGITRTAGTGTLTLNGNNSYSGGTIVNAGTLVVGSNTAVGTGLLNLQNATTLQNSSGVHLANTVSMNVAGVTIAGSNILELTGAVTLPTTLTNNNATGFILSGSNSGAALTLAGSGVTFLKSNTSRNAATTINTTGTVVIGAATPFGPGALTLTAGTLAVDDTARTISMTGALTLGGSFRFVGNNSLTINTGVNTTTVGAVLTLTVDNDVRLESGLNTGTNNLTLNGLGKFTLANANSGFSGGLILNMTPAAAPFGARGTLVLENDTAAGSGTITLTAGNLQAGVGPRVLNNAITLSSGGTGGPVGFVGSNSITFNGLVTATAATTCSLVLDNTAPVTFAGGIANTTGALMLTGTGTLNLPGTNSYTGATTVLGGTLNLSGASGALTGTTAINVATGGTLLLDNTTAQNANRVLDTAVVTLSGGTLDYRSSATLNEVIGTLTLTAGHSTINLTRTAGNVDLTFNALSAVPIGATVNFTGNIGAAASRVLLAQPAGPTLTNGILPWATVNGTDFAGYDAATPTGITVAPTVALPGGGAGGGAGTENALISGNTVISGNTTINSLKVSGPATITINQGQSLTINSGALLATGGTITFQGLGTLNLGATQGMIRTNTGTTLNISSVLAGTNLTISGGGTLRLSGTNTYTGTTTVNSGTLIVNNGASIQGTLTLLGGTLQTELAAGVTLTNAVTMNNSSLTFAGSNPFTLSNTVQLNGNVTSLTITNTAPVTLSGIISSVAPANPNLNFLNKLGNGKLVLTNTNTYTAQTNLLAGTIAIRTGGGLGGSAATAPSQGTVISDGATLQLLGSAAVGVVSAEPIVVRGTGVGGLGAIQSLLGVGGTAGATAANALSGAITLTGQATVLVDNGQQLNLTGIVNGTGGITKMGQGFLQLAGANTYTGRTDINEGLVEVTTATGLGTVGSGTTVANGATLQLNGAVTFTETVTLTGGSGFSASLFSNATNSTLERGALVNVNGGAVVFNGDIQANGSVVLGGTAGTVTVNGQLRGTDIKKIGAGAMVFNAANTFTGSLNVALGSVTLANTNPYTGATNVGAAATLVLNQLGRLSGTSSVSVGVGGTLTIDNGSTNTQINHSNRIADAAAITLNGANFNYTGSNVGATPSTETLGAITLASGQSTITMTVSPLHNAPVAITTPSLTRVAGATANFVSAGQTLGSAFNRFLITSIPALVGGVVPGLTSNTNDLITHSGAGTSLAAFTNFVSSLAAAGPNDHVRLSANETLTGNLTVGSIQLLGNTTLSLSGFTLNVQSGNVLVNSGTGVITGGTLNFGASGGTISSLGTSVATIQAEITGSGGLGLFGAGTINLPRANSYTGSTSMQGPTVTLGHSNALSTGPLTLDSGTLQATSAVTLTSPLTLAGGNVTIGNTANVPIMFTGVTTISDLPTLTINNTGGTYFTNKVTGSGGLVLAGTGTLFLSNTNAGTPNDYSGGTVINAGLTAVLSASTSLGSGLILVNAAGGTLVTQTALSFSNITQFANSITFAGAGSYTFTNTIMLLGGNTTLTATAPVNFTGTLTQFQVVATRVLTVAGNSTVTLTGPAFHTGGTTMAFTSGATGATGVLALGNDQAAGSGALTLTAGVLQANAALTPLNPVSLGAGPFATVGSNITFAGLVTVSTNSWLVGNTVTLAGGVTGGTALTFSGTPLVSGNNTYTGGGIVKLTTPWVSGGTATINIASATFALSELGSLTNTGTTTVNLGGTLTLDNSGVTAVTNRFAPTASLTLNGGTLSLIGSATAFTNTSQTANVLTLNSGHSKIVSTTGTGGNNTLTFASLSRPAAGATIDFQGVNAEIGSASNQVIFTAQPTLTGGVGSQILPYATVSGAAGIDFATQLAAATSISRFATYDNSADINSAATGSVFKLTSSTTNSSVSAPLSLNAVLISGTGLTLGGGSALTLSGGAILNTGNNNISVASLVLGSEGILRAESGTSANVTSAISGGFAMTLGGGGSITLNTANTYTGTTTFNNGTLTLAASNVIPGALSLTSGTIQSNAPFTTGNTVTFNTAASAITLAGSNAFTFTGTVTLGTGPNSLVLSNTGGLSISGAVGGSGALLKSGASTLTLTGNNGYTGLTLVTQGIVSAQSTNALGTTANSTIIQTGATLEVLAGLTVAEALTLNGTGVGGNGVVQILPSTSGTLTLTGTITLLSDWTINVPITQFVLNGAVSGLGGITKTGNGVLTLGTGNSFTGAVNVNTGILEANNATALGTIASPTIVANVASITIGASITGELLTIGGSGVGQFFQTSGLLEPRGAMLITSNNSTFTGNITMNGATTINVVSGVTATISGMLAGTNLTKVGPGTLTLSGGNTFTGSLAVQSGVLTLANRNDYTGATTVGNQATLTLNSFGTARLSTSFDVTGTLNLDNNQPAAQPVSLTDRIGDSTPITLRGASFNFIGSNFAGATAVISRESFGQLILASGNSTITSTAGTATSDANILTSTGLTRSPGATASFVGVNATLGTAFNQILFIPTAPALTNGILPYATVTSAGSANADFATYGPLGLAPFANYVTSLAAAGPNDNVKLTASEALTTGKTINSLLISGNVTVALGANTLNLASGGLSTTGGGTANIIGGTLAFAGEGLISNGAITSLQTTLSGSAGLTLFGNNQLTLPVANNVSGNTNINMAAGSVLFVANNTAFSSGTLFFNSGTMQPLASLSLSNAFAFSDSNFTFQGSVPLALTGTGTLSGNNFVTFSNTGGTTFGGRLTGTGTFVIQGAQTLFIDNPTNNNDYSGGTILTGGAVVAIKGTNPLGSGTITHVNGTLGSNVGATLNNSIVLTGGTLTLIGSANTTYSGNVTLLANNSTITSNTASATVTTFSGIISEIGASRTLTLNGLGTIRVSGVNTYTGGTTLGAALGPFTGIGGAAATVELTNAAALGTGTVTFAVTGGTLQASTPMTLTNAIVLNGSTVTLGGSNALTFSGSVSLTGTNVVVASNTAATTISGVVSGAGGLTLAGTGTLTLTGANTYTGATIILDGTLLLNGGGTLANTAMTINHGGTLILDNVATNNTDRLNNAASLTLAGGTLSYLANAAGSTETIGAVTLTTNSGLSTIRSTTNGGNTTLTFASLTRNAGTALNFAGVNTDIGSASNQIIFTAAPALSNGLILPYATVTLGGNIDFATVTGTAITRFAAYDVSTDINTATGVFKATSLTTNTFTGPGPYSLVGLLISGTGLNIGGAGQTLSAAAGATALAILNTGGSNTISVSTTDATTVEAVVRNDTGATLNMTGNLNGTAGLTVVGAGTVSLTRANTYTGNTTLDGPTLSLGTNNAISSGTLFLSGGTLQTSLATGLALTNAVTLTNSSVTLGGANPLILSGTVALAGNRDTITVNGPGSVTLTGVVSGAAILNKTGAGTLTLTGTNTYTGITTISQGVINIQNAAGLGGVANPGGTIISSGATLQLQGGLASTNAEPIALSGTGVGNLGAIQNVGAGTSTNVLNSALTLLGDTTIGVDVGQITATGIISGSASLTKIGTGILSLQGTNTFHGDVSVNAGILDINNLASLGSLLGATTVTSGTLQVSGAVTVAGERLSLNGNGLGLSNSGLVTSRGALSVTANATWTGNINLTGPTTIGTPANFIVQGVISGGANLTKVGAGTLDLRAANTWSGTTAVNVGTLSLTNSGTVLGTTGFTVAEGATLTVDNTTANLGNRIGDLVPVALAGGALSLLGNNNPGAASSESLGQITLQKGQSTISSTSGTGTGASAVLSSTNLLRTPGSGATMQFVGNTAALGTALNQILFTAAPSLTNGILPYATLSAPGAAALDFATYGGQGVAALTNYVTSLAAAGPNDNVRLTANETLSSSKTVNSLLLVGGITVQENGQLLTLQSGALLGGGSGTPTVSGGTVSFGGTEGIVSVQSGATLAVNSALAGTAGATLTSFGTLTLNSANTYTGGTTINGSSTLNIGIVQVGNNSALSTGTVTLVGGILQTGTAGTIVPNAITMTDAVVTFGGTNAMVLSGPITATNTNYLTFSNAGGTILAGQISGGGTLAIGGTAAAPLLGANTYSGGTIVGQGNNAVLTVNNSASLGTGSITLVAGTIQSSVNTTLNNSLVLNNAAVTVGSTVATLTFGGTATLTGVNTLTTVAGGLPVTFTNTMSGSGNLTLAGSGQVTLSVGNAHTGGTAITGGTVTMGNNSAFGNGVLSLGAATVQDDGTARAIGIPVFLTAAATISPQNSITVNSTISGGNALTKSGPGTLTLTAPNVYTGTTTLNQGTLSLTTAGSLISSGTITVNVGTSLQLDNQATNLGNRLNDTAAISMAGGAFSFLGNTAGLPTTETIGAVTIASGYSTISSTVAAAAGSSNVITALSLARAAGQGMVNFAGVNAEIGTAGINEIRFTNLPARQGSAGNEILNYAIVTGAAGTDYATQAAAGASIVRFANYDTNPDINAAAAGSVFLLNAATTTNTLTASHQFNAILIRGTGLTLGGADNLTYVNGLCVLVTGGSDSISGALALGGTEAKIITDSASTTTISTAIASGTGGLTFGGAGTIQLNGNNAYTGNTILQSGILSLGNTAAIAANAQAQPLIVNDGKLVTTVAGVALVNNITLNNTLTVGGANAFTLGGTATVMSGGGGLTKTDANTVTIAGTVANTYTGTTTINSGTLTLSKTAGQNAIPTGPIVIGDGTGATGSDLLSTTTADVIGDSVAITIARSGQFTLGAATETIGSVSMAVGPVGSSAVLAVGANTLTLNAAVGLPFVVTDAGSAAGSASASITGTGTLALGANRTFIVADTGPAVDLDIQTIISGGVSLTKIGAGTMQFSGAAANTYSGTTTISEGTLLLAKTAAVTAFAGPVVVGDFAGTDTLKVSTTANNQFPNNQPVTVDGPSTLDLNGSTVQVLSTLTLVGNTLNLGAVNFALNANIVATSLNNTAAAIIGNLNLGTASRTFNVAAASTANASPVVPGATPAVGLDIQGVISGNAAIGFTKLGAGTLLLRGTTANTYTGSTLVNEGNLWLGKTANIVSVPGPLVIGDGIGGPNTDTVRLLTTQQIGDTLGVDINTPGSVTSSGLLDLNDLAETIGPLGFYGGTVTTGPGATGALTLTGNVFSQVNSASAQIIGGGKLLLNSTTRGFTVADGPQVNDLIVTAIIDNGGVPNSGVVKDGLGTLQFTANNLYTGTTQIIAGTLVVDGQQPGSAVTIAAGAVLMGTGRTGAVTDSGSVSPGHSPGILSGVSGNVTGGNVVIEISGFTTAGVNYDRWDLTGPLTIGANSTITLNLAGLTTGGVANGVIQYSSVTGTFANIVVLNNTLGLTPVPQYTATALNISFQPGISISGQTLAEGNSGTTAFVFPVTLSTSSASTITVNYTANSGTATVGEDFQATSGTLTFAPGSTSQAVTVLVNGDTKLEPNETFTVDLSGAVNGAIVTSQGVGSITNDDGTPSVSIAAASVSEGNSSTTPLVFQVTLSNANSQQVTVQYITADGTATTADGDYQATSGTVTFAPGSTQQTVTVLINGDTKFENNETFSVSLSNPNQATLGTSTAQGTINNDDSLPAMSIGGVTQAETNSGTVNFVFTVTLSNASFQGVTAQYSTADGSATTADADYQATSGTVSFAAGTTQQTVTVLVNGDTKFEPNETFTVQLTNPSGGTLAQPTGTGSITNDDTQPTITIGNASVFEGNSGSTPAVFTVTLSNTSSQAVTVQFATADNSATAANNDYTPTAGTVTFAAGSSTQLITVQVIGDTQVEPDETFFVQINNPVNATLSNTQGTGTIFDDDVPVAVQISINDVSLAEGNGGQTAFVFTVSLTAATSQTVAVSYTTADGTATTADGDYQGVPSTSLTFAPGQTARQITVQVNGDTKFEAAETFFVQLSNPVNATISDNQGQGTIVNDDTQPTISVADISQTEGTGGTTPFVFTISLSNTSSQAISLEYSTLDGSATAPADYAAASGSLTFAAGETQKTVTVQVQADTTFEPAETFFLNLQNATNATFSDGLATATIGNDDSQPTISIGNVSLNEGNSGSTTFGFTVSLTNASYQTVTVVYNTADGTATVADGDYQSTSGTLSFAPGSTQQTVTVLVTGDTKFEGNETFVVNLSNPSNAALGTSQGTGTIANDDALPTISIGNVSLNEGQSGTTSFAFAVTLSNPSSQNITVVYATADGTATLTDGDYQSTGGTLTFAAGTTQQSASVLVVGDTKFEANETFAVQLSNPTNAGLGTSQGTGTIANDDAQPTISISNASLAEGNAGFTNFVFSVSLSNASSQTVTVNYATADGTATVADGDYQSIATTTLSFTAGQTLRQITVQVNGDTKFESDETFLVQLSSPANATISQSQGTGTIANDDGQPTITIADATQTEGNSGTTPLVFSVTLSNPSSQAISLQFATQDGTALSGSDFAATSGTLNFAAGQTAQTLTVQVNGDTMFEPAETFLMNLASPVNATFARSSATGTIANDDSQPTISINNVSLNEGQAGTTSFVFTVSLSNASSQAVSVNYQTSDGTATTADPDYQAASGSLTFSPGSTQQTVTVLVNGDTKFESDETFSVLLSNPVNASLAVSSGQGTIVNDDTSPTISINDVSLAEGQSGNTAFVFTVSLSNATAQAVTVNFATANGTATTVDGDYSATSGSLSFSPGSTVRTLTVQVTGDTKFEGSETFFVNLSGASGAALADSQGQGTIANDDSQPTVSISSASISEGNAGTTSLVFTLTLSNPTDQQAKVNFATSDATATTADGDYQSTSGTATFAAGTTQQTVTVLVNGDTKFEQDETFNIQLSNPQQATLGVSSALGTILNDDPVPSLSINNVTANEGQSGTSNFVFAVTLSNSSSQQVTVVFNTANGTATTADGDYSATTGTLTFSPGATQQTVTVQVNGDNKFESNETFQVQLSNPSGATLAQPTGQGTISNDDPQPALSINSVTVTEGNSGSVFVSLTVTMSNPSDQMVTLQYATSDGTATAGSNDYVAISPTGLTFQAGETQRQVSVAVNGDTTFEPNEQFFVNLSNASNATLGTSQGSVTILNDDGVPTISINNVSVDEGQIGLTNAVFTLTLSNTSSSNVTVVYNTSDSTATVADADYQAIGPTTLTFFSGETSKSVTVQVVGDQKFENNETFFLSLSNSVNATLASQAGLGTIRNDDAVPSVSIGPGSVAEGNSGTRFLVLPVTVSTPSGQPITVDYMTLDNTALVSDNDYQAVSSAQLSIAPGQAGGSISIVVVGDLTSEPDESFFVRLTGATGATIGTNQAAGTILNDDGTPTLSVANVSQAEGNSGQTGMVFTASLSNPSSQAVTVQYVTSNNTATTVDGDYLAAGPAVLTFQPGQTQQFITVQVQGDTRFESDESFFLNLSNAVNANLQTSQAQGTILNDDPVPSLSIGNVTANEGNGGITNFVFTVSLSNPSSQSVTVAVNTSDSSASVADNDYNSLSTNLTFAPGSTSANVTVQVQGDTRFEQNETFLVLLSNPSGATLANTVGNGVIVNDDVPSQLSIGDVTVGSPGTELEFAL